SAHGQALDSQFWQPTTVFAVTPGHMIMARITNTKAAGANRTGDKKRANAPMMNVTTLGIRCFTRMRPRSLQNYLILAVVFATTKEERTTTHHISVRRAIHQ